MRMDHHLTPHTDVNSKEIKGLNVRHETRKLLKTEAASFLISVSAMIFWRSPEEKATKAKINKLDYVKLKSLFTVNRQENENAVAGGCEG